MSDKSTSHMIDMYMEEAEAPMFLSGFFTSPPRNFHTTEKVEIDIMRDSEDVAIVITDLSTGARLNENDKYTNKAFTPPIFKEAGAITGFDMIKRQAGQNPFQDPDFGANAMEQSFRIFRKLERKIRRSIELMASQVLQTGILTLIDENGVTRYTLDFLAKATHMATVSTAWATDGSTGTPINDLASLARIVRQDGKKNPDRLCFGSSAMQRFLANADVKQKIFNNFNSPNYAGLTPQSRGEGATFMGWVWVDNYRMEMWLYDGYFKHPQTGTLTPYISPDNVIMTSSQGRLDLSYGAIPRLVSPESRALPFMPQRMSSSDRGLDFTTNAWLTPDGEHLMVSAGTRPLTIPTAIDTFARLDVTP